MDEEQDVTHLSIEEVRKLPPGIYVITREQLEQLGYKDPTGVAPSVFRLPKLELPPKTGTESLE